MAANDNRHVITVADPTTLAATAAEHVLATTAANSGRVAICLTGGSSPKQLYQLLATEAYRSRIPWQRVHWFIGDERFVPADDPLNNMGMARTAFLSRCAPPANIHPIPTATAGHTRLIAPSATAQAESVPAGLAAGLSGRLTFRTGRDEVTVQFPDLLELSRGPSRAAYAIAARRTGASAKS
jgi:6-phosphogluconolactonase/glucosamine-6-phosphate isomerase/deaminase